jgi:hypothetical protein
MVLKRAGGEASPTGPKLNFGNLAAAPQTRAAAYIKLLI